MAIIFNDPYSRVPLAKRRTPAGDKIKAHGGSGSMTATKELKAAITKRHDRCGKGCDGVLVFELATGTGYSLGEPNKIDAFFMACKPSEAFKRVAYEIKISRSDFLREMKKPLKRRGALRVSNQFYFVTTEGLVKPEEIPLECGLLELKGKRLVEVVPAPYHDSMPSSWHFFAAFARRILKIGKKIEEGKDD